MAFCANWSQWQKLQGVRTQRVSMETRHGERICCKTCGKMLDLSSEVLWQEEGGRNPLAFNVRTAPPQEEDVSATRGMQEATTQDQSGFLRNGRFPPLHRLSWRLRGFLMCLCALLAHHKSYLLLLGHGYENISLDWLLWSYRCPDFK